MYNNLAAVVAVAYRALAVGRPNLGNFALIAVAIALVAMNRKPGIGFCNILPGNVSNINCGIGMSKIQMISNAMGTKFTYIERPYQTPLQGAGQININRNYNLTGIPRRGVHASGLTGMIQSGLGAAYCSSYQWNSGTWIPFTAKFPTNIMDWETNLANYYDIGGLTEAIDVFSQLGYQPGDNVFGYVRANHKCHSEKGLPLEWIIIRNGDWAIESTTSQSKSFGGF
jgi:hypothetical protein